LAAVKYPTAANTPSKTRTAIPRFIAILDAIPSGKARFFAPYTPR
jgi:hypothetical protein